MQIQMAIYTPLCLEVTGGSTAEGQTVETYPCISGERRQQWSFVPVTGPSGAAGLPGYHIVNVNSLQCMTVSYGRSAPGTPIIQAPCYLPVQASQVWSYSPAPNSIEENPGPQTGYTLTSAVSGLCLDIPYGETSGEANMQVFTCTPGDPAQAFVLKAVPQGNVP